jgi:hypothetical protein
MNILDAFPTSMLLTVAKNTHILYNNRTYIIPTRIKEHAKECAVNYTALKFAVAKLETTIFDLHADLDKGLIPKQYVKQMKQINNSSRNEEDKKAILSIFFKELFIQLNATLDIKLAALHTALEPTLTLNKSWLHDQCILNLQTIK